MADVSTTLIQNNCSIITGYLLLSTILYKSGQAQQTCPFINAFLILLHIDFHQSIFGLHSHYDLQLLQFCGSHMTKVTCSSVALSDKA